MKLIRICSRQKNDLILTKPQISTWPLFERGRALAASVYDCLCNRAWLLVMMFFGYVLVKCLCKIASVYISARFHRFLRSMNTGFDVRTCCRTVLRQCRKKSPESKITE
jgi:hypothetical protein